MPYEIRKEGDQHCLYKKDDNKKIACHDTEDGAKKQMMAIQASEHEKTLERYTQEAVAYTQVSMTPGEMCANCRWFIGVNQGGNACHIIDTFPLDIEPTGYCNKHESVETAMAENMPMMQEMELQKISADYDAKLEEQKRLEKQLVAQAERILDVIEEHDHNTPAEMDTLYIAPQPDGILKSAIDKLTRKGGLKPGASVIKANGTRYMLVVTSNSYQDREQETITTQALKEYVDKAWIAEDLFHSNNPLLFWHDDRLDIGQIVWADMHGPFLVELAQEGSTPVAKALFDYREAHPDEKWGASHRFAYFKKDRAADGTYKRIYKQETSILPREAAANLLTFSGVLPMTDKRGETLNKMLGLDNAAELLDKGIGELVAELSKRNIEHKSADKPAQSTDADLAADAEKVFGKLVTALIDNQADLVERQDALESGISTSSKSLTDETAALKEQVKALTAKLEAMQVQLDQRPRSATRASETEIADSEKEAALKKQFTKRDPFFGVEVKE